MIKSESRGQANFGCVGLRRRMETRGMRLWKQFCGGFGHSWGQPFNRRWTGWMQMEEIRGGELGPGWIGWMG
jgi:hypothetical protein